MSEYRNRVREFRRVRAGDLVPHPKNWRTHPRTQADALRVILAEIGFADVLLTRELDDGRLQLVDGHLRAETVPDMTVPVAVLDLDEREAELLLMTLDPLAMLAETDAGKLDALVERVRADVATMAPLAAEVGRNYGGHGGTAGRPIRDYKAREDTFTVKVRDVPMAEIDRVKAVCRRACMEAGLSEYASRIAIR